MAVRAAEGGKALSSTPTSRATPTARRWSAPPRRPSAASTCCSTTPASCTATTTTRSPPTSRCGTSPWRSTPRASSSAASTASRRCAAPAAASVINTASFVAVLGAATPQIAYTASKGAVLAMTRELAVVHARENIRVNALCPGPCTPSADERARHDAKLAIAGVAALLSSRRFVLMTGAELVVDGGITLAHVTPSQAHVTAPHEQHGSAPSTGPCRPTARRRDRRRRHARAAICAAHLARWRGCGPPRAPTVGIRPPSRSEPTTWPPSPRGCPRRHGPEPKPGFERFIRREPLGTVLVAPWNYPFLTSVNAVLPAIVAGNAVG